jgi:hypothetical protein
MRGEGSKETKSAVIVVRLWLRIGIQGFLRIQRQLEVLSERGQGGWRGQVGGGAGVEIGGERGGKELREGQSERWRGKCGYLLLRQSRWEGGERG